MHCTCATCQQSLYIRIIVPDKLLLEDNTSSAGVAAALYARLLARSLCPTMPKAVRTGLRSHQLR
jgi:hypothetical protein